MATALADFLTGFVQHRFVVGVLPQHQPFQDAEQPFALDGGLLLVHPAPEMPLIARIVDHLREDHRPCRRQRPPRPPQMQRAGVPVPDRLLPSRRRVDDEFSGAFDGGHVRVSESSRQDVPIGHTLEKFGEVGGDLLKNSDGAVEPTLAFIHQVRVLVQAQHVTCLGHGVPALPGQFGQRFDGASVDSDHSALQPGPGSMGSRPFFFFCPQVFGLMQLWAKLP